MNSSCILKVNVENPHHSGEGGQRLGENSGWRNVASNTEKDLMTFNTSFVRLGDGLVIRVEKLTMNELELRIIGEDHTLGNLIAKTALNHPNVQIAAYSIDHPLVGSPRIVLVTDGSKAPLDVLKEVINKIIDMSKELLNISEKMFEE